jgi:hypothetical protein
VIVSVIAGLLVLGVVGVMVLKKRASDRSGQYTQTDGKEAENPLFDRVGMHSEIYEGEE